MSKGLQFYVKVQKVEDELGDVKEVVGICDVELLGKTFKEGGVILVINKEFFGGFKTSVDEALEYLRRAYTAMIVGQHIVRRAINAGLIHPESVRFVKGIPYAQMARM